MVIQNKKQIKCWSIMLILTIICTLSALVFVQLLSFKRIAVLPILIGLSLQTMILFNLTYFEYEHSGELIIIRKSSFWNINKARSTVEFPIYKLLDYSVRKNLFLVKIEMILKSERRGQVKIKYKLLGLSFDKINLIQKSLKTIIKENHNEF